MSLIKYRRGHSLLDDIRNEMNQLFNTDLAHSKALDSAELSEQNWTPLVDIKETDESFHLKADVPGVKAKDLKVFVDDNHRLVMKGERGSEHKEERDNYVRIERTSGSFYRAFGLPENVDTDSISAKVNDGQLDVIIPKKQKSSGREIPVSE